MPVKVIVQSFIFQVYYGALVFFSFFKTLLCHTDIMLLMILWKREKKFYKVFHFCVVSVSKV